ncbi:hypothetical protein A9X05_20930 [Mycobacterium sp. E3298]|nr:hypothetical protein A9X05_20930 [Mycobacterium sp. E3298]
MAAFNAFVAAPGSANTWMVSLMTWLPSSSLNVVAMPGWPFGLLIGGVAVNGIGALMSLAWISNPV